MCLLRAVTSGAADWPTRREPRRDGPFRTLERAREAVRKALRDTENNKPVAVFVRAGTYELVEPIVFTPEDSGTETRPVTWAAFPGEQAPIVSGGKRIDGWRTGENGVWHADMPAVKEGRWYFRQLFTNGKRRMRARIPNEGFFQVEGSVAVEEPSWFISRQGDFDPAWAAQKDTEVIVLQAWAEIRHHITAYDPVTRTVTLSRQCSPYNREKDARYYLENVREGLDSPGEWYLDRETGVLSYIPLPGEDMNSIAVVAPVATELVRFEGDPGKQAGSLSTSLCAALSSSTPTGPCQMKATPTCRQPTIFPPS